jgi:hypothetical protein
VSSQAQSVSFKDQRVLVAEPGFNDTLRIWESRTEQTLFVLDKDDARRLRAALDAFLAS